MHHVSMGNGCADAECRPYCRSVYISRPGKFYGLENECQVYLVTDRLAKRWRKIRHFPHFVSHLIISEGARRGDLANPTHRHHQDGGAAYVVLRTEGTCSHREKSGSVGMLAGVR